MHIPDGELSGPVCAAAGALSLGAVSYSLYKLRDSLADRTVPLTGMVSALIFAGQMVNFPLFGTPVSGHLMGGVLAGVVLGPWAGCIALTLVLVVQCFLFSDGGVLALGANILHMAVIGSMGGYVVYASVRRLMKNSSRGIVVGTVIASWLSVMAAAALFCLEFQLSWASDQFNFSKLFTLMVSFHSAIGIGEALITGGVVSFVLAQRPDLIYAPEQSGGMAGNFGKVLGAGIVTAMAVAAFLAPFASQFPDGLEAVAQQVGFEEMAGTVVPGVLEDYEVPLPVEGWQKVSVSLAGMGGTAVVLIIAFLLGRALKPHSSMAGVGNVE